MAAHSSTMPMARSTPPLCTMSPTAAAHQAGHAGGEAMSTHFSHMSCRMLSEARAPKRAVLKAASRRLHAGGTRTVELAVGQAMQVAVMQHRAVVVERRPRSCTGRRARARRRSARAKVVQVTHAVEQPGRMAVSGPTAGANESIVCARGHRPCSRRHDDDRRGRRRRRPGRTAATAAPRSPCGLLITRPVFASCAARRGRSRKVTSFASLQAAGHRNTRPAHPRPLPGIRIGSFLARR